MFDVWRDFVDRELDAGERRKGRVRRLLIWLAIVLAAWALLAWGFGFISPSLRRSQIRTARVDAGPVDSSLSATGTVVPEVEQVLSSPVDARVLKVLKRAGSAVRAGEPILSLDTSASVLTVDKLDQDIALKANQQSRAKLMLENTLADLDGRVEIKQLQLETARLQHVRNTQLFADGLLSQELLRQSEVAERQAGIELKQLETSRLNARAATKAELDGLTLELTKLQKERIEARRVLELATASADRDGVVTWTLTEEGAAVSRGAVIARIADLSSYRVDASVSDAYVSRLRPGLPVQVRADDKSFAGTISDVLPTVQNGVVTVRVALADKSNPLLRPNLRVEAFVVTGHRDRALRVAKGSSTSGEGYQQVFVVRGDRAERVRARFGIASFDFVEVLEGLSAGDEVIVSDMTDFQHLTSIRLR
jgi:HlyD family secretion protein